MVVYKCFKCRREVKDEGTKRRVRCPYCSSNLLYKQTIINRKIKAI